MATPQLGNYRSASFTVGGAGDAFGSRPAPIIAPNPAGDLGAQYPRLSETNAAVSDKLLSQLRGELSPDTIAAIQDASATFGITSGMPGSGLQQNLSLRDIGRASEQQQQLGLQNYGPTVSAVSNTQTLNPALQNDINTQNAIWAAAPDPSAAGLRAEEIFNKYLESLQGPAGGTGGGAGGKMNPIRSLIGYTSHGVGGISENYA